MVVGVAMTLLMYASPIMYPSSAIPAMYKPYLSINPIAPLIETFRFSFTGRGEHNLIDLTYSFVFMLIVLFGGIFLFNKTEKTFMDTI
jgi:lipopolysaccharide transport system permease protein